MNLTRRKDSTLTRWWCELEESRGCNIGAPVVGGDFDAFMLLCNCDKETAMRTIQLELGRRQCLKAWRQRKGKR